MPTRLWRSIVALVIAVSASGAWGQARIVDLGVLPGDDESHALGVSRDGLVVFGRTRGPNGDQAFRWSQTHGMESLGTIPDAPWRQIEFYPRGISDDGRVITGNDDDGFNFQVHGFRWVDRGGMIDLGALFESFPLSPMTFAYGVTGDGQTIVGTTTDGGFLWTPRLGMQLISGVGEAVAITEDGTTVLGVQTEPLGVCLWRRGLPPELIVPLTRDSWVFQPHHISDDGSVAIGLDTSGTNNLGVVWRREGGLGHLIGPTHSQYSSASAVSGDGSVIGGSYYVDSAEHACIWDLSGTCIDLSTYLLEHGANLDAWMLGSVTGLDQTGNVVVGIGEYLGVARGWIAYLSPPCLSSDYDHDGDLGTDSDIEAFFACLAGSCCSTCYTADLNGDGRPAGDTDIESFFRTLAGNGCY